MTLKELINSIGSLEGISSNEYWMSGYVRNNRRLDRAIMNIRPTLVRLVTIGSHISAFHNNKCRCKFDSISYITYNYKYRYSDRVQFFTNRKDAVRYYNKSIDESISEIYNDYIEISKIMESNKIKS